MNVSDVPVHRSLIRRPVWGDRLLWLWLASLPIGYAVIFHVADGGPLPPNSGAEWVRTASLFLFAWSVAALGAGLLLRVTGRRAEARLTRIINGRQHRSD